MWVFTNKGFISAVQHRDDSTLLMIRARTQGALAAVFPKEVIIQTESADYRYRTIVQRTEFMAVMCEAMLNIDYDNFKNSIPDAEYHDACSNVWRVMHATQPGSYYAGVPFPQPAGAWVDDFTDGEDYGPQPIQKRLDDYWPPVQVQTQANPDGDVYGVEAQAHGGNDWDAGTTGRCVECSIELPAGEYCTDCFQ